MLQTSDSPLITEIGLSSDLSISRIQTSSANRIFGIKLTLSSDEVVSKENALHGVASEDDQIPIHRDVSPTAPINGIGVLMMGCDENDPAPWGCGFVTSFDFFYSDGGQSGNMGNLIGDYQ